MMMVMMPLQRRALLLLAGAAVCVDAVKPNVRHAAAAAAAAAMIMVPSSQRAQRACFVGRSPRSLMRARLQILWVLTDDQDIELGGLTPMKFAREHLGEQGAVGEAFYVNTPM
jgi:hypothetical protein